MGFVTLGVVEGEVRVARHGGIGNAVKNSNGRSTCEGTGNAPRTLDVQNGIAVESRRGVACIGINIACDLDRS